MHVQDSEIHGLGVFTDRKFLIGEIVLEFQGDAVDISDTHTVTIDGSHIQLDKVLRYVNHSLEPNCIMDGYSLRAVSVIEKGEEITFDYDMGLWRFREHDDVIRSIESFKASFNKKE